MRGGVRRSSLVIGREGEQDLLRRGVRAAHRGEPGCIFVVGEGGIGKTRLLSETVAEAQRLGVPVLLGRSSVAAPAAFGVVAEALRSWLRTQPAFDRPRSVFDAGLRLLLPEWPGEVASGLSDDQLRFLALEGLVEVMRDIAAANGAVLVLDDLHGADAESVEAIRYLASAAVPGALIIGALRDTGTGLAAELVDALERADIAEAWPVDPLPRRDVEELLAALLGARPPTEIVDDVMARTDGVPLLVEEVIDAHLRAGSVALDDRGAHWRGGTNVVPRNVAAVVASRLDRLPRSQRDIIIAAAVVGDFDATMLTAITAEPIEVIRSAFAAALNAGIVETLSNALEFRHAVVGDAVQQLALPDFTRSMHARAADFLDIHASDDSVLERRARHLAGAGDHDRAALVLVSAVSMSLASHALLRAEVLARAATDEARSDMARASAADALAATLTAQGRWSEALELDQATVATRGQSPARWQRMARCALDGRLLDVAQSLAANVDDAADDSPFFHVTVGRLALSDGDAVTALDRVERALTISADAAATCAALDLRARALDFSGDRDAAARAWKEQEEVAARADLTAERLRAVVSAAELELLDGRPPMQMFEAVELARTSGAIVEQTWAELNLSIALSVQGDPVAGERVAAAAVVRCRALRLDLLPFLLVAQAGAMHYLGDDRFAELLTEAIDLAGDAGDMALHANSIAAEHALHEGTFRDAVEHLELAIEATRSAPGSLPSDSALWLVFALAASDRAEEAEAALATVREFPDLARWHTRPVILAAAEALLAHDTDSIDAALASATSRMPFDLALVRVIAAEVIGGPERTRWLREALDIYEAHDGGVAIDRVRALLRDAGGAVPRRRAQRVPADLIPLGVTAREAEVLALVTEGLSNAAIAKRLYLSVRTIESHVSSLLAKLGTTSRQELASAVGTRTGSRTDTT